MLYNEAWNQWSLGVTTRELGGLFGQKTWVNILNNQKGPWATQDTLRQKIKKHGIVELGVGQLTCWSAPLVWHKGKSKAQHYPNRTKTFLFERVLRVYAQHTWLNMIDLDTALFPRSVNSVSQFGHLYSVARLTLGLALSKPTGSGAYDMTLFPMPPLISTKSLGQCAGHEQRISHACANLSSSIFLSRSQHTTTWQSVSPTPSFTQPPT